MYFNVSAGKGGSDFNIANCMHSRVACEFALGDQSLIDKIS